jgi:hypothetical protein
MASYGAGGGAVRSSCQIHFELSPPFFPRRLSLPSPPYHPLPLFDMPTLPQGRLWVLCMFPLSFSVGIQPMYKSTASSIVFSCVVMGLSVSLLFTERPSYPYMDSPGNPASKWRQPPGGPNPNPNPNPPLRNRGLYFPDADEFHTSEILGMVSSALNGLVATAL